MSFLSKLLGVVSGNNGLKISDQLLFDKIIGFKGAVPGVGTSTIVQNTAIALAETTNLAICVLDTNYLFPTQYPMLINAPDKKRKDFLDFTGDISDITLDTEFKNITLVSMSNRGLVDMLSSKDSEITIDKLMGALKIYFDIVLVDLSNELTNVSTHASIKCNKVFVVADQSLKCVYNFRKSINTMATLAVPPAKANKVIINKVIPDVLTNTKGVIEEAGLKVLGEIPFSVEIAKQGVAGKRIWTPSTSNHDIYSFSSVIETILDDIVQKTPLNENNELLESEENNKKSKKTVVEAKGVQETVIVQDSDDDSVEFANGGVIADEDDVIGGIVEDIVIDDLTESGGK